MKYNNRLDHWPDELRLHIPPLPKIGCAAPETVTNQCNLEKREKEKEDDSMDTKKISSTNLSSKFDENKSSQDLMADPSQSLSNKETSGLSKKDVLVLVVDDIVDNVVILSLDLQHQGYRVITASNGEEAVKIASLTKPNIILMDIGMPLLDGLGATAKIREDETLRTTPVVAITAFSTSGFRRAAYDVGFDGYLTKPIDFDQLHELIHRLLPRQ